ncbi:MAG: tetratricopeptide repeat protein [Chitinophagaceae bacterium]|nr:tetratricopeptide repeat protein [Chitinophagaceae bacterium]
MQEDQKVQSVFFKKLLEVNPNNVDANYWLGQSYLALDEILSSRVKSTKELYQKALQSSANAPLLIIGMGEIDLMENRTTEARQKFESALEMTKSKRVMIQICYLQWVRQT